MTSRRLQHFEGQVFKKFFIDGYQTGNCSFICTHKLRHRQDIVVHGVVISGQCYTHPLLLPDLPLDHHMTNLHNSSAFAIANDPVFAHECTVEHVWSIVSYHQTSFTELEQQFAAMPDSELKTELEKVPFRQHIIDSTPIHALRVKTERML